MQRAQPAPQGSAPDMVGEATPALLLAPVREVVPLEDCRPPAPTEAPPRLQWKNYRQFRSPLTGSTRRSPRPQPYKPRLTMAARNTAGPIAPLSGTTSAGPRSVPPETDPRPQGAETTHLSPG